MFYSQTQALKQRRFTSPNVPYSPPQAQTDKNALYWHNKKESQMGKLVEGLDNRSKVVCVKWIIITMFRLIEQTLS